MHYSLKKQNSRKYIHMISVYRYSERESYIFSYGFQNNRAKIDILLKVKCKRSMFDRRRQDPS